MIGQIVTDEKGLPIDGNGKQLAESAYQPPKEIKDLFARIQTDFQTAWSLQHHSFDEFDGISLLDRARLDQQTFAAYVGAEYVPQHKKWRWKGRKNTARNKLIGILAHMLAGMLYPFVYAKNEKNEEDKMTGRVMRILVEEYLRKAGYEVQFLYIVLSALVNPAVFVGAEFVNAIQSVKKRMADGSIKVIEAVDELLSGLNINVLPIDEVLLGDFYTHDIQHQPFICRVRRISYDEARKIHSGKHFAADGTDLFDFVNAGQTHWLMAGQDGSTLFDVDWTEADANFVQELTVYYRAEDLEVTFVGGVFMGDENDPYNSNAFKHRRLTLIKDEWISIPLYPIAKGYFEPIDPSGRFVYGKSGAFKEYWDDKFINIMTGYLHDGTALDIIKPVFLSGVAATSSIVMAPGATYGMPTGGQATPFSLGPNLAAAYKAIAMDKEDMAESTQDKIMNGIAEKGVTAYATNKAEQNARTFLGVFGLLMAQVVTQLGGLVTDIIVIHETVGELDYSVPEALKMKFKTILAKGKDKGKNVTNRVVFTDQYMGRTISEEEKKKIEWNLYDQAGGPDSDQRIFLVNPYQFARTTYSLFLDADKMVMKSMGADRAAKVLAFNVLTDPRVAPYTDQKAVIDDFAIEEFGGDDPDRYKKKGNTNDLMNSIMGMGQGAPPAQQQKPGGVVVPPANVTSPTSI